MVYLHKTGLAYKKYTNTFHLFTDNFQDNFKELHKFASELCLKPSWFQESKSLPHYDVFGVMHQRALDKGAILLTSNREVVEIIQLYRAYKKLDK